MQIEPNPAVTTSVYVTSYLQRRILCGINQFLAVNHSNLLVSEQHSFMTT